MNAVICEEINVLSKVACCFDVGSMCVAKVKTVEIFELVVGGHGAVGGAG
jgi:hypothetical protein